MSDRPFLQQEPKRTRIDFAEKGNVAPAEAGGIHSGGERREPSGNGRRQSFLRQIRRRGSAYPADGFRKPSRRALRHGCKTGMAGIAACSGRRKGPALPAGATRILRRNGLPPAHRQEADARPSFGREKSGFLSQPTIHAPSGCPAYGALYLGAL